MNQTLCGVDERVLQTVGLGLMAVVGRRDQSGVTTQQRHKLSVSCRTAGRGSES